MTSILAVTLARGGSKGCSHKHVRILCGKPVLEYTIDAVQRSKYLNDYVVSSDDPEILRIANACGVDTIMRPVALAQDETPTIPALVHAVETYEKRYKDHFDYIIEVRATSPLKTAGDIDGVVQLLLDSGADSVIGVTALEDHHPARAKWIDDEGRLRDFIPEPASGRRQDLHPKAYIRNGTVYALTRAALDSGKLFGHTESLAYVMPAERSVNIDTDLDLVLCNVLLQRQEP